MSEYSLTMVASGRDRLLGEALKLFAARGYAATSVADIQKAAGLAPGSGALYKHFASKRALLEAAVAHRIESIVAAREEYDAESPAGVEKAVRRAGQLIRSGNSRPPSQAVRPADQLRLLDQLARLPRPGRRRGQLLRGRPGGHVQHLHE